MKPFPVYALAALLTCCITLLPLAAPAAELEEKDFTPEFIAQCKSRAEAGEADGQALYARALLNGWGVEKNGKEGYEWSRKSADAGSPLGMRVLGNCYFFGDGGEKDMTKAAEWYRKAADLGDAGAMFNLGTCYIFGDGVEKDMTKAAEWFRKAADLGDAGAMHGLGTCYFFGNGIEKDMIKAIEWYRKAAELGNADTMHNLAVCYERGYGVEKDSTKAEYWMEQEKKARAGTWTKQVGNTSASASTTSASAMDDPAAIEAEWKAAIENATRITTAPRMAGADAEKGEGLLEAFGTRYMPNAYAAYQKARETAKEREQLLRENFPNGRESDSTGGGLYDKIAKNTAKAVAEMLRYHDELCHFYVLHRAGGVTDEQLAEIDSAKIAVRLPEESLVISEGKGMGTVKTPTAEELTFAAKYLPEIHQANQTLRNDLDAKERDYAALRADAIAMDSVRSGATFEILAQQIQDIRNELDDIVNLLKQERLLHTVGERTSDQLADIDQKKSLAIREFRKTLPYEAYLTALTRKLVSAAASRTEPLGNLAAYMVPIPGKNFSIARYEVSQRLWQAVMGYNPSEFKGADNPVECVSWNDCQKFLKKFNALPEVKKSGLVFRLPTEEEWEYACRAGATGDYCKLANGTEITRETLGKVAWFDDNSDDKTHPVGQKEPNAFGLYDMHGNVLEWTQTADGECRVDRGGSWDVTARYCESSDRDRTSPDDRNCYLGFRLCASGRAD